MHKVKGSRSSWKMTGQSVTAWFRGNFFRFPLLPSSPVITLTITFPLHRGNPSKPSFSEGSFKDLQTPLSHHRGT